MSPVPDLNPLLPDDEERCARREALVAEIGGTTTAAPGTTRRAFVRGGLAFTGAAAAALAGTAAVSSLRGSSLDVVASARAATAPMRDGLLHVVVRYRPGPHARISRVVDGPDGRPVGTFSGDIERWSTDDPLRLREVVFLEETGGAPQATIETAYADGVVRIHDSWRDAVRVQHLSPVRRAVYERERRGGRGALGAIDMTADPVATIRTLLANGALHDAGRTELSGRAVQRLVGREVADTDQVGTRTSPVDFEYLVDAKTFAPVRITSRQLLAARPGDASPAAQQRRHVVHSWTFERFDRLPLDARTSPLLRVSGDRRRSVPGRGK